MDSLSLKQMEIYAYADLASGKEGSNKRKKDRQAIVVGGRDHLDRWFILYEWAGYLTATAFLNKILDTYDKFRPRRFGIESNGMQILFGSLVRDAAHERFGSEATFLPVSQPTNVDKDYRIRSGLEPIINQGKLFIQDKLSELALEIRGFPTAKTKDLVDALETMIRIAPKHVSASKAHSDKMAYAKYLRSTGMNPADIRRKLETYV